MHRVETAGIEPAITAWKATKNDIQAGSDLERIPNLASPQYLTQGQKYDCLLKQKKCQIDFFGRKYAPSTMVARFI